MSPLRPDQIARLDQRRAAVSKSLDLMIAGLRQHIADVGRDQAIANFCLMLRTNFSDHDLAELATVAIERLAAEQVID